MNSNFLKLISIYGSRLWSILSMYIFIPVYIHILGIESYAIIGFYALMLGIISFADAGMSSAVIKEFSIYKEASYKYSVFRKLENCFIIVCVVIFLIISINSNIISTKWLTSKVFSGSLLSYYVSLIGCGIAIQLLSNLYFGALFGLGKQVEANIYQTIWNICRTAGVVLVLIFYRDDIEIYLIGQIVCNVVYILFSRYILIKKLKEGNTSLKNSLEKIPSHIFKYIGGMTLIAIISAVNSQSDKVITSSFFSLEIFGYYNIISTIAQAPIILAAPLGLFIFPIFSKLSAKNDILALDISFSKISFLLNIILFPAAILIFFYSSEIIHLWTGNIIDNKVLPQMLIVLKLLIIGSLFLAMQFPFFYYLLAKDKTKYTIYQGVLQIVIGIPLLYFFVKNYGLITVGIPWICINFGALVYLMYILFNKYLNINFALYFKQVILFPFFISIITCGAFYLLSLYINFYFMYFVLFSGLISVLLMIICQNKNKNKKLLDIMDIYHFPENN